MNVETEVIATLQSCGVAYSGPIVLDGNFHRVGKNKSGWYIGYSTPIAVCVCGDWKTGVSEKFIEARQDITPKDRQRIAQQMREAAAQREAELKTSYEKAANQCRLIWRHAEPMGQQSHPYLVRKNVLDEGLRIKGSQLVVPVTDGEKIHSLQFIHPDGEKRFYPGGRVKGMHYRVGLNLSTERVLVCEGLATGLTLLKDTNVPVFIAFNAGNLRPVARAIRMAYPASEIIIAGDDDRNIPGNPGATKAREAAIASGATVAFPRWPEDAPDDLTDFNDLACWLNRGAV
ncbi:MAG TPA: toprim domain-containing protein [Gammaproteobacteria bacterium]|nr:toprim domain-containing protein [Gammaproteobacteria bacterium]